MSTPYYILDAKFSRDTLSVSESELPVKLTNAVVSGQAVGRVAGRPAVFFSNKLMRPVDLVGGLVHVPIVSPKMRAVVEGLGESLEFTPVKVVCKKDDSIQYDYEILNVLNNLDAFDREKSVYRRVGDLRILPSVDKLVLKESEIGSRSLFRLSAFPGLLICSGEARSALEAAGLTGLSFQLTTDFS